MRGRTGLALRPVAARSRRRRRQAAAPRRIGRPARRNTQATAADGAPIAFGICKSCHSVEKGKNMIGPSLAGIVGTKAGDVAGFSFSPALRDRA
jgi:cytochrome c